MSKMDRNAILKLCEDIKKSEGDSIYSLGSESANLKMSRWKTGIEDLDNIIGGGMPEGRIVEIYGSESAGKTTLAYHMCGLHEMCLDIPIEGTFDAERAKVFGNRPKQMLVYRAQWGEDAMNKAIKFAQKGIPLIVIDSVPFCTPYEDVEKIMKAVNKDAEIEQRIGGVARLMTKYMPVLNNIVEQTGTTVIMINQVRDAIGALPFTEQTKTPGGHILKHSYSLRLQVARKGWIEIPNYNPSIASQKEKIGLVMKVKVTKSKISNPQGECEIPLFFDRGFVSFEDVDSIRDEIMKEHKVRWGKRK